MKDKIIGLIILAGSLWLGLTLYGNHKYTQGVAYANLQNETAKKEYEDAANERIAEADAGYRASQLEAARYRGLVSVRDSDIADSNARIAGLLNSINHARPKTAGGRFDEERAEWITLLESCTALSAEQSKGVVELGAEAARLADKTNGLIGYVRALK